jgi:hypothetical protein
MFDQAYNTSTFIVVTPYQDTEFKNLVLNQLENLDARIKIISNPMLLHAMLVSQTLPRWRKYLTFHEDMLIKLVMTLLLA